MKWVKRGIYILIAVGIIAVLVRAYMPKPTPVEIVRVRRGLMKVTVEAEGKTRVIDRYVVSASLSGQLARVEVHPADQIREGSIIARILPMPTPLLDDRSRAEAVARVRQSEDAHQQARATEERARLALDFAQRELTRQRGLVENGSQPRSVLEQAEFESRSRQADLNSARFASRVAGHAVETARVALGRLESPQPNTTTQFEIVAPADGQVLRVLRESAGFVTAGTPLVEVGDPAALEIVVDVLTADAAQVTRGSKVVFTNWGGLQPLDGQVRLVEPSAFTRVSTLGVEEQRVNLVVDILSPREQWRALGDGYRVEASVEIWRDANTLIVPTNALFRFQDQWAVFVIEQGKAKRKTVTIGRRNPNEAQVLGGLQDNEQVIAWPGENLSEGMSVVPR